MYLFMYHVICYIMWSLQHKQELEDKLTDKEEECRQYNNELQCQLDTMRRKSEGWAEEKESLSQVRGFL